MIFDRVTIPILTCRCALRMGGSTLGIVKPICADFLRRMQTLRSNAETVSASLAHRGSQPASKGRTPQKKRLWSTLTTLSVVLFDCSWRANPNKYLTIFKVSVFHKSKRSAMLTRPSLFPHRTTFNPRPKLDHASTPPPKA